MTNFELVHSFVYQEKASARANGGNLFYNGNRLYSYGHHYLLAEIGKKGTETYILINDSGYSITTQRHVALVVQASSHLKQFFLSDFDTEAVHDFLDNQVRKLALARKPELYISEINRKLEKFNAYYSYFPKEKKGFSYKKYIREIRKIERAVSSELIENSALIKKISETEKKKRSIEKKRKEEMRALQISQFMKYIIDYVITDRDVLRVSKDGLKVETTQGLRFSIDDCRQLYGAILKGAVKNGSAFKHYTVTSIDKKILKIGCHNLCMKSVHAIGKQISG